MPAPTPFTMEDVVNGVLLQMRFAPGRDVQIHLQDSIAQDASILYRTLMRRYIWRDFIYMTPFNTDANGLPIEDLTAVMSTFSDIAVVYKQSQEPGLPFAPALINPGMIQQPTVIPAPQPKVFRIFPVNKPDKYYLWSRVFKDTNFDLDDPVPFYRDILVLGTAFNLATKAGINTDLTGSLKQQFDNLVKIYIMDEVKDVYSTRPLRNGNVMTDWYVTDSSP
jgi:hypothetical protein